MRSAGKILKTDFSNLEITGEFWINRKTWGEGEEILEEEYHIPFLRTQWMLSKDCVRGHLVNLISTDKPRELVCWGQSSCSNSEENKTWCEIRKWSKNDWAQLRIT